MGAFSNKGDESTPVNNSNCGRRNESVLYDKTALVKFITESCKLRLRNVLKSYFEKHPAEEIFMKSRGVNRLEELIMDIVIGETEQQRLLNLDETNAGSTDENGNSTKKIDNNSQKSNNNLIAVTIICYCSIDTPYNVIIYFRSNSKWIMVKSGKVRSEDAAKELSTAWISTNSTKHLDTHRKFHSEIEINEHAREYITLVQCISNVITYFL